MKATNKQRNTLFFNFWLNNDPDMAGTCLKNERLDVVSAQNAIMAIENEKIKLAKDIILEAITIVTIYEGN